MGLWKDTWLLYDLINKLILIMISFMFLSPIWQVPNVTDLGLKPRWIKKVAVIGGGLMGSGIATALILSGTYVILKEIDNVFLQKGLKSVAGS